MSDESFLIVLKVLCAVAENDELDLDVELKPALKKFGWTVVREALFEILKSPDKKLRYEAMSVLWGAVLDARELDANVTIAHIYFRHDLACSEVEDNLAWSITSRLKGKGYLSDYDPLADHDVKREIDVIRSSFEQQN